jgi:hypothetical protein
MKKILFLLGMIACGGQTIGDLDSGTGSDSATKSDTSTGIACTKGTDCGTGQSCAFPMSDGCAAKGQCVANTGPLCNSFSPGCACDGTTINIACTGLPDGYATAPFAYKGQCAMDAGTIGSYTCGTSNCIEGKDICYSNAQISTCMPANGCTDCKCAQAMFQCISTCKQSGQQIYIQCN